MGDIEINLKSVENRKKQACLKFGRNPDEVVLVGVSKMHPAELAQEAFEAGLLHLGENKIQEAERKIPQVDEGPIWHMIGHLQSNKVKKAVKLFDIIETIDSVKLAETISKECVKQDIEMKILLELNSSGEKSKFGFEAEEILSAAEKIDKLDNIELRGLMTVGPLTDNLDMIDESFKMTQELYSRLQDRFGSRISILSMGMSSDFEQALIYGSTELRIGTAIFGRRNYN